MTELENLLIEKQYLIKLLRENTEKITNKQILKPLDLAKLGFEQTSMKDNELTYVKELLNGYKYTLFIDLSQPKFVALNKSNASRIYGFPIESLEDFKHLLSFLNCY